MKLEDLKKHDKVCILGTAPSLQYMPWEDPSYDVWACAPVITNPLAADHIKQINMLFEIHPMETWNNDNVVRRLNEYGGPVLMQDEYLQIPGSIKYPLTTIRGMTNCSRLNRYFTSTISYMIALAIHIGYKQIDLFGVHMAAEEEYGDQRQACESWLAFAAGRGIDINIPDESEIFRCNFLYGYEQVDNHLLKFRSRKEGLKNGLRKLEEEKIESIRRLEQQRGALMEAEYWERSFR